MSAERALTTLFTQWGEQIDQDCPLEDYPRPQMRRDSWHCLNGRWEYAIRDDDTAPETWDGTILVPFSPESVLSGVERQLLPGQTLWYRRDFDVDPPDDGHRLLLHFGAVDQRCRVIVNDVEVCSHVGGYWPFELDITDHVSAGRNTLVVRVTDDSDQGIEAYGKQKLERGKIWYTAQSGIWQTVWTEVVPEQHIAALTITPHCADSCVEIAVTGSSDEACQSGVVDVTIGGNVAASGTLENSLVRIPLPQFRSWTPDDPFLYGLRVRAGGDEVESYFGMREFGMIRGADGHKRLALNGKPIMHNGLLDQGYWSDGLYTPPSDDAMIHELETIKSLGFNMVRKHIKIEPLRWYYHCDRLGLLVWQDFVSGGGPYHPLVVQAAPWMKIGFTDGVSRYRLHGRGDPASREAYKRDMVRTVDLLRNAVGLTVWVPFNEGWGQFDSAAIADEVRQMDPTRLIDHASGYFDQGAGDFQSCHVYFKHFRPRPDKHDRVLALTEFGGYSLPVKGHMTGSTPYGYKMFTSQSDLRQALEELYEKDVAAYFSHGLSAIVYTQVSDVEDEINGLFTYDRRVLKIDSSFLQGLNARMYDGFASSVR